VVTVGSSLLPNGRVYVKPLSAHRRRVDLQYFPAATEGPDDAAH
jgi:hypothetical protein